MDRPSFNFPYQPDVQPSRRSLREQGRQQQQQLVAEALTGAGGGFSDEALAGSTRVFVGVVSGSRNKYLRNAIRATWGAHQRLYRVRFFLLQPRQEDIFEQVCMLAQL